MNIHEKIKNLPLTPGVYLMNDFLGNIIYIGKAKKLKNRVQSYFQNSKNHSPKVRKLVQHIHDIEYILTDTEFEALLLECKLIKEWKPLYNKKMKSPQIYPYIAIHLNKGKERIEITNHPSSGEGMRIFGPYTSRTTVEKAIQAMKEFYKINCSNPSSKTKTACLNYSLGTCVGICLGDNEVEYYQSVLKKITALLEGTDLHILEEMKSMMHNASENFDFKGAAKYRDSIEAINILVHKEKMIEFTKARKNIVMLEPVNDSRAKLFLIKGNQVLVSETYDFKDLSMELLKSKMRSTFFEHPWSAPENISKDEIDEAQIIFSYLKSNSCLYTVIQEKWLEDFENSTDLDLHLKALLMEMTS